MRRNLNPEELGDLRDGPIPAVATATTAPNATAMRRLAHRYFGPLPDELYPDSAAGLVLRIDPERTRAWDFADDLAALGGQA